MTQTWNHRFKKTSALLISTAFGAGFFPRAPGTMGSLVALPLIYWSAEWAISFRLALWLGIFVLGTWAAKVFDQTQRTSDNQKIVIDEVLGMGVTALTAGRHAMTLLVAFILFRLLDILKPAPIRQIDSWSKKKASQISANPEQKQGFKADNWWGGFGVMADDLFAGFQGLLLIWVLQRFQILP